MLHSSTLRGRLRPGTCIGAVLVALFAAWYVLVDLQEEPFFPDELSLVAGTYYWNLYCGNVPGVHDPWDHVDWLRYPAYDHPPMSKYLIGLGMNAGGAVTPNDLQPWFQWLQGDYAAPQGLYWARLPIALCGVGACLAVFALGVLVRGRLVGLAAAMLLAANPLFLTLSRRAMRDVPAEAFGLATVLFCCWMWPRLFARAAPRSSDAKRRWHAGVARWSVFAVAAGSLGALATLTRLTGVLAWLFAGVILLLAAITHAAGRLPALRRRAAAAEQVRADAVAEAPGALVGLAAVIPTWALIAVAGVAVLWLLNPFLHASPSSERIATAVAEGRLTRAEAAEVRRLARSTFWQRLRAVPEFRRLWSRNALQNPQFDRFDDWRLRTLRQRARAAIWQGFGRYSLFGSRRRNWNHEMTDPETGEKVERFASCLWPHRHQDEGRPGAETKRTFPCHWPAAIFLPLTLWGLACMVRGGWKTLCAGRAPMVWGAVVYALANIASVILYIPFTWDRYFLPIVTASALPLAYGVATLLRWFGGLFVLKPPSAEMTRGANREPA